MQLIEQLLIRIQKKVFFKESKSQILFVSLLFNFQNSQCVNATMKQVWQVLLTWVLTIPWLDVNLCKTKFMLLQCTTQMCSVGGSDKSSNSVTSRRG